MNMKRIIPARMYVKLQAFKGKYNIRKYNNKLSKEEAKYFALPGNSGSKQLKTRMLFFAHQVEKGLSHSDFRAQFGRRPISMLNQILNKYYEQGYDPNSFELNVVFSVLKAYKNKHIAKGEPLPPFYQKIYNKYINEIERADIDLGGAKLYTAEPYEKTYQNIIKNRISIREFGEDEVDVEKIQRSISVAMHAPSVCNRQSQQVRVISNPDLIRKTLEVQGGWRGYAYPPILILISSHLSSFLDAVERTEPYVDGGIFAMALLGALEAESLGACPLNTMFSEKQDRVTREILGVPDEEVMIMFIALGNKPQQILHPVSKRRSTDSVVEYLR